MNHSIVLTRDQSREIDRRTIEEFGMPSIVLMENAGRGIFNLLLSQYSSGKVFVCCGKGNNAGDGFVVARYLNNHDIPVSVLLFSDPELLTGDAQINYDIALKFGVSFLYFKNNCDEKIRNELAKAAWIIDAIFGTGLVGDVKAPYDAIISAINATTAKILSIDIPSGLDCDTGKPLGVAITADYTATCIAFKKGFLNPEAKGILGHVHVIDIGVPKILMTDYRA